MREKEKYEERGKIDCLEISQTTPLFTVCCQYFDNGHSMPRNIEAPKNREFCG